MKKFPNKVLTSLAVLTMAGAGLAACKNKNKLSAEFETALGYMKEVYKNEDGKTKSADFELAAVYMDDQNRTFTIDWTLEVLTAGAENSVKLVPGKTKDDKDDANVVKVDIDEESEIDVDYKLTAVMHYGEEKADLASFTLKMPKLHIATWEEYVEACKNSASKADDPKNKVLSVEGIVTAIIGTKNGNSHQAIYVQDLENKGAYYAYDLVDGDPAEKVSLGQKVRLTGQSGLYSGTYELLKPSISKVLDTTVTTVTPTDYTQKFEAATKLNDASITAAQGLYVSLSDVIISDQDVNNGYYKFKKGSLESYVRISSSVCPISKANQDAMKADHKAKIGYKADVKGIICLYDGAFYLTPIDAQPFTFKGLPELSDADAVAFEKERLSTTLEITKNGDVALSTAGAAYTDVAITWASSNATLATVAEDNSKVTYKLGETTEEVKLTATLKRGSAQDTKEFTVKVIGVIPWKTVAEVKELEKNIANKTDSESKYYVYGEITTDPTADYCNFTLSSGDDDILVYGVWKDADNRYGTKRQISEIPFKKGDKFFCNANIACYDGKWELTNALAIDTPAAGSTFANPLDAAGAMAIINTLEAGVNSENKYFVQGVIEDDVTADYCNFHIGTGDNSILVYGVWKDANNRFGTKRQISEIPFKKGDVITLKANLQKYVKDETTTPEMTNAELVSYYTPAAPFEVTHAGTAEDPYTIAEALFIGKSLSESKYNSTKKGNDYGELKDCYVKGLVTDAGSYVADKKAQNNMKLKDNAEGKELLVYTINFLDGEGNADPNGRVYVNDEVVVKGTLMFYSGTVEISSVDSYQEALNDKGEYVKTGTKYPNFVSITRGNSAVTLGDHDGATVTGLPTEAVANGSMVENVVVTPDDGKAIKSVKANGVALTAGADGKYSFKVEGPMTITVATGDANANVVTGTQTFDMTAASYDANPSESAVTWTSSFVVMKLEKSGSNTPANNYLGGTNAHTRVYAKQALSFTAAANAKITGIVFTCTSGDYATKLKNGTWTNGTAVASSATVTVTVTDTSAVVKVVIGDATRFTSIAVEYEAPAQA